MSGAGGLVAGIGQRFAGDDGVGIAVARALLAPAPPPGVDVRELTDPSRLIDLGAGRKLVIVVDALLASPVAAADDPDASGRGAVSVGDVLVLRPDELERGRATPVSSHGLGVAEALTLLAMLHPPAPRIVLVGVVIGAARRFVAV